MFGFFPRISRKISKRDAEKEVKLTKSKIANVRFVCLLACLLTNRVYKRAIIEGIEWIHFASRAIHRFEEHGKLKLVSM